MNLSPEVAKAHSILHRPGQVVEVRCINQAAKREVYSGTFCDDFQLFQAISDAIEHGFERIQWSINGLRPDYPVTSILRPGQAAARKADVSCRDWIFIDFDWQPWGSPPLFSPLRIGDIRWAMEYLKELGVIENPEDVFVQSSGWGINLLVHAGWNLAEEGSGKVATVLQWLAMKCAGDGSYKIDAATASPERGIRVPGTLNVKRPGYPQKVHLL